MQSSGNQIIADIPFVPTQQRQIIIYTSFNPRERSQEFHHAIEKLEGFLRGVQRATHTEYTLLFVFEILDYPRASLSLFIPHSRVGTDISWSIACGLLFLSIRCLFPRAWYIYDLRWTRGNQWHRWEKERDFYLRGREFAWAGIL